MNVEEITAKLQKHEEDKNRLIAKKELLMENLKKEGYPTIKKAKAAIKALHKEADEIIAVIEKESKSFTKKYGKYLK